MSEMSDPEAGDDLSQAHYAAIARFRYELRRFLAFSAGEAARVGLPSQQHQALLVIAGRPEAQPPTVGALAEELMIAPHTAAELVARMVEAGLVGKTASRRDGRRVELALTPRAEALLRRLTAAHLKELKKLEPALTRALGRLNRRRPG